MALADDVNLETLAERTDGYVGADIKEVVRTAASLALREFLQKYNYDKDIVAKHLDELRVEMRHFEEALKKVKPSAKRLKAVDYDKVNKDFIEGAYI